MKKNKVMLLSTLAFVSIGAQACAPKPGFSLDKYVASISKYSAIGVGEKSSAKKANRQMRLSPQRLNDYMSAVLVGADEETGEITQVEFTKDGSKATPNYPVRSFTQTENYILVNFSMDKDSLWYFDRNETKEFFVDGDSRSFIIDKKTGKTFKLTTNGNGDRIYFGSQLGWNGVEMLESSDSLFGHFGGSYYKFTVADGVLKVDEIMSWEKTGFMLDAADVYGNCAGSEEYQDGDNITYIVTTDKKIKDIGLRFNIDYYLGFDHKFYHGGQVMNENGEFVPADKIISRLPNYVRRSNLIYSEGDFNYYFGDDGVYRVDMVRYSHIKTVSNLNFYGDYVILAPYIYYVENGNVIKHSIKYDTKETISFDRKLFGLSIASYDAKSIMFTGLDEDQSTVVGTIDLENNVTYDVTPPSFASFTIYPIN